MRVALLWLLGAGVATGDPVGDFQARNSGWQQVKTDASGLNDVLSTPDDPSFYGRETDWRGFLIDNAPFFGIPDPARLTLVAVEDIPEGWHFQAQQHDWTAVPIPCRTTGTVRSCIGQKPLAGTIDISGSDGKVRVVGHFLPGDPMPRFNQYALSQQVVGHAYDVLEEVAPPPMYDCFHDCLDRSPVRRNERVPFTDQGSAGEFLQFQVGYTRGPDHQRIVGCLGFPPSWDTVDGHVSILRVTPVGGAPALPICADEKTGEALDFDRLRWLP